MRVAGGKSILPDPPDMFDLIALQQIIPATIPIQIET
jgi:hypothetical protein